MVGAAEGRRARARWYLGLVTHGGRDLVAPKSHSDSMVATLKNRGKDVTYIVYPSEPHDYRNSRSWVSFWAVAERFLHDHLGGQFEDFGKDVEYEAMEVVEGAELVTGLKEQLDEQAKT